MSQNNKKSYCGRILLATILAAAVFLSGCGPQKTGGGSSNPTSSKTSIQMEIPDSLTGKVDQAAVTKDVGSKDIGLAAIASKGSVDQPCHYIDDKGEDHFRNGYQITKFLVSAIATWSCIGDLLIDISDKIAHDGVIRTTDNDFSSPDYKPKDPTHYSVTDDSDSQTTIRLYYAYDREAPPAQGDDPQFYISWNEGPDDALEGRIIVDAKGMKQPDRKDSDPTMLRMDFKYTAESKKVGMFLRFDAGNPWAEGFRIEFERDMDANPHELVYLARGLIKMKTQFFDVDYIDEIPTVQFYTVTNRAGEGAAVANFEDVELPIDIGKEIFDNHLGNYLFSKKDSYFFQVNGDWDYINKSVTSAVYRGGRTTRATGEPLFGVFDPSLETIIDILGLPVDYFTGGQCENEGDDCTLLIQSIFDHHDSFAGHEQNQGSDPNDWRSLLIATPDYLTSIYPDGSSDWTHVFDFVFIPTL